MARHTIPSARFLHAGYLKDIGNPQVGSHFIQRYSSDDLCQSSGGIVIRESALLVDHRNAGIGVHVDICQADLHLEAEPGVTNEQISRRIIRSLFERS